MSKPHGPTSRWPALLALLFIIVFAAVVFERYLPWGRVAQPVTPPVEQPVTPAVPALVAPVPSEAVAPSRPQQTEPVRAVLMLDDGPVELELRPDIAPLHVAQITTLIEQGFYDGIVFHRVIDGFMAQTGDPTGTGAGGSELPDLPAEFSTESFSRGTLGMARSSSPNSANSQFFITLADAPHLDGQYTVFGRVVSGMEHVDAIKKGDRARNGSVSNPDAIVSLRLAE